MNTSKDHIISLLSQGIPTSAVAAACGVTDSYVSQLKADPEIAEQIAAGGTAQAAKDVVFDSTLERAELMALEKIEKNLPFANMGQAMAAFRILNSARKRSDAFAAAPDQSTTITVNLTLPTAASARYVVNSSNEIVEVEGKTMITATAKSLDNLLAHKAASTLQQPALASMNRAAGILANIPGLIHSGQNSRAVRKLPNILSADIL